MLALGCLLLPCLAYGQTVVINEFMAQNTYTVADDFNEYDDWIELYNPSSSALDVGGLYLTDNFGNPSQWRISASRPDLTTIKPGGFLLIWADGQIDQGPLHASFKLSASGEAIGLFASDGVTRIDGVTFGAQQADRSYARIPDGAPSWQVVDQPTPGRSNLSRNPRIVINEIMFHPLQAVNQPEDVAAEFIELFNAGPDAVDLSGWRFSKGVGGYAFPVGTSVAGGGYLVVAADVDYFEAFHPWVTNIVGGWPGKLSNAGDTIELVDRDGVLVNRVTYADEGDWAVRELGPAESGQRGWEWSNQTDGGGRSLELINPDLPNEYGQSWAASKVDGGTPGLANSVAASAVAPFILDVTHTPIIPRPDEPVTVTARIIDQQGGGLTVGLRYRVDKSTYQSASVYPTYKASDYTDVTMFDDGAHGDGQAGDRVYAGQIPAMPHNTIVEFFIQATNKDGKSRTWPAPSLVDGVPQQVTNLLYQVDQTFDAAAHQVAGTQPIYYVIMTEMERGRLAYIGKNSTLSGPDAQMNGTFISLDATGIGLHYTVGIRNRGHGTRNGPPNNYHVNFPHDRLWKGLTVIDFNCRYTHSQIMGSAVFQMAGFVAADMAPAQLRINGANLAYPGTPMYGVYVRLEAFDDSFAKKHLADDPKGNLYQCFRTDGGGPEAELRYEGTNPDTYRNRYFKANNGSQDNWSDLIHMLDVLNNAPEATYLQEVSKVINVDQWLHYIALDSLVLNYETGLNRGIGDDYFMYCGAVDHRFVLVPHDLDTVLNEGNEHGSVSQSIFSIVNGVAGGTGVDGLKRFFGRPEVIPLYYQALLDLTNDFYRPERLDPLFDEVLGGFTPKARIDAMKLFVRQRIAAVLAQIPQKLTVSSGLTAAGGYPHTTSRLVSLTGQAHASTTRRVTANGQPATWAPLQCTWSITNVGLFPGINRVVIQTFDAAGKEAGRSSIDIWCDTGAMTAKAGGTLADEVWTAAAGPYHVTGTITVPAGRTLTIQPGATVFLDSSAGLAVYGRLVAQGTEYQRIRLTRVPGTSGSWAGLQFTNARQPNVLAYADVEYGDSGSQCISIHNSQVVIDHATFFHMGSKYLDVWEPQVTISHSTFGDLGGTYHCTAEHMLSDGWFIVYGNLFGKNTGDNDIFHLNRMSVKGGHAAEFYNNVFTGAGDDLLDDNESDTHIEGNLLMHANKNNAGNHGASAAVTTGPGGSTGVDNLLTQHLTVVRNVFYENDYGIISKTSAYSQIYNNVFIGNRGAIMFDETDRSDAGPGRAADIESCIFWDNQADDPNTASGALVDLNDPRAFDFGRLSRGQPQVTVNNSILPAEFHSLGTGNLDADPLFVHPTTDLDVNVADPAFRTGFEGFDATSVLMASGLIPDLHLHAASPAIGSGFNGVDMGAYVPSGASIGGVPSSPTPETYATLTVAGLDIHGYRYRLTHSGHTSDWSGEMQQMKPVVQILLSGSTATATCNSHGYANGDLIQIMGADALSPFFNGTFPIFNVTANTFSYSVVPGTGVLQSQTQPRDLWCRREEPIQLTGLTNGTYTVEVIRKNSMGVWQDANDPATAAWTVDTSFRRLVINEVLAANQSTLDHEGTFPGLVELYYDGPGPLDLSGMMMTNDANGPNQFVFPGGTSMAPGQYLVLFADVDPGTSGLHLGFALNSEGDRVYLYDRTGVLLDSIQFGLQLADLSVGRVGSGGQWHLTVPTFGQANVTGPLGNPDTVKINEWLANEQVLFADDFIELYNPNANPVDLGGLFLTAKPGKFKITPLSFIAGSGYAVFRADGSSAPGCVSFRLSSDGDMIGLFDGQLKEIDRIIYGPQTTDVSQGRVPDGADTIEFQLLPTPGVANPSGNKTITATVAVLGEAADKRVLVPTAAVSDDWKGGRPFDDSKWTLCTGAPGGVGYDTNPDYKPLITLDTQAQMYGSGKNNTCYIRIPFVVDVNALADVNTLTLKARYDDGFVAYFNGTEVARANFTGTPSWNSHADSAIESAITDFDAYVDITAYKGNLKAGTNILAIHAMNASATSSDFLISVAMDAVFAKVEGQPVFEKELNLLDGLRITELMYYAAEGSNLDYIELQNVGGAALDLTGVRFTNGVDFVFPHMSLAPGQFVVVAANGGAFRSKYGSTVTVAGQYSGKLSNTGEEVVLSLPLPLEAAILRFTYEDTWYPTVNGGGDCLVINDPLALPATWNESQSWHAAAPSPGRP